MPAQDDLLAPLAAVLGQIQARLSAIEGKVGIDGPPPPASGAAAPVAGAFYVGLALCYEIDDDTPIPHIRTNGMCAWVLWMPTITAIRRLTLCIAVLSMMDNKKMCV